MHHADPSQKIIHSVYTMHPGQLYGFGLQITYYDNGSVTRYQRIYSRRVSPGNL